MISSFTVLKLQIGEKLTLSSLNIYINLIAKKETFYHLNNFFSLRELADHLEMHHFCNASSKLINSSHTYKVFHEKSLMKSYLRKISQFSALESNVFSQYSPSNIRHSLLTSIHLTLFLMFYADFMMLLNCQQSLRRYDGTLLVLTVLGYLRVVIRIHSTATATIDP